MAVIPRGVLIAALAVAAPAAAYNPVAGDFSKANPLDVRIVAYNTEQNFIATPSKDVFFNRILTAIQPDIICFEEIPSSVTTTQFASRMNAIMPIGGSGWQIHFGLVGGTRNVLASRYSLTLRRTDTVPISSTRGVTIALADLPNANYSVDVYLLGVHLKCCGNPGGSEDQSRQRSADAISNWLGDARGVLRPSGNWIILPAGTPMIVLGDCNLVGGPQPGNTLVTGNIIDEATFGADVKGDWDVSDMLNLNPLDPFTGNNFTWQGSGSFPPSALDRMFITDSAFNVANSFVLNTATMTPAALAAAGLLAGDTSPSNSSDHLPIAMDLRLTNPCAADSDGDGTPDCTDGCPVDAMRVTPGVCGCGVSEALHGTGDMNGDGRIDGRDIPQFVAELLVSTAPSAPACRADLDESGLINAADAALFTTMLLGN